MFEEAKKNLNSMALVGITERWEESVQMISAFLGIEMDRSIRHNVGVLRWEHQEVRILHSSTISNSIDPQFSPRVRQLIAERNSFDIALYQLAQEKFAVQAALAGIPL